MPPGESQPDYPKETLPTEDERRDAFARLFAKHDRWLFSYLVTLLGSPAHAEEVFQEVASCYGGDFNRFNQLFPSAHTYFGFIDAVQRSNVEAPNVLLTLPTCSGLRTFEGPNKVKAISDQLSALNYGRQQPTSG